MRSGKQDGCGFTQDIQEILSKGQAPLVDGSGRDPGSSGIRRNSFDFIINTGGTHKVYALQVRISLVVKFPFFSRCDNDSLAIIRGISQRLKEIQKLSRATFAEWRLGWLKPAGTPSPSRRRPLWRDLGNAIRSRPHAPPLPRKGRPSARPGGARCRGSPP